MIQSNNWEKEYVLYGIDGYVHIINDIKTSLHLDKHSMDIRLILTEALNNAYRHGNLYDNNKPIFLRCYKDSDKVKFEIEDTGDGLFIKENLNEIKEENILLEGGRGLYLIKSFADEVSFNGNTITITKKLV